MRLPRLHLRTLLIAVAAIASALGGFKLWERRQAYLDKAAYHSGRAVEWHERARKNRRLSPTFEIEQLRTSIARGNWVPTPGMTTEERRLMLERSIAFMERGLKAETARWEESIRAQIRNAEYHEGLAEKYRIAARLPWIRPAPDPPSPQ